MDSMIVTRPPETDDEDEVATEAADADNDDWDRFNRMMRPHFDHDVIASAAAERRMIAEAQREIKAWSRRTRKLGKIENEAHDLRDWKCVRRAWPRSPSSRGVRGALGKLMSMNYRLIFKSALKFQLWGARRGFDASDLFDIASIGFMHAVRKFSPAKRVRLSTYSALWMRAEIGRALRGRGRLVCVPYNVDVSAGMVANAKAKYLQIHGRAPDDIELAAFIHAEWAKRVERSRRAARKAKKGARRGKIEDRHRKPMPKSEARKRVADYKNSPIAVLSADAPTPEGGDSFLAMLTGGPFHDPASVALRRDISDAVRQAVDALPPVERWVIRNRFLNERLDEKDRTLVKLGKRLPKHLAFHGEHVSRERIRQIQTEALKRLRKRLAAAYAA